MAHGESSESFVTGNQFEDYLVGELLFRGTHTLTWSATQLSIQREVIICSLLEKCEHDEALVNAFFADVRAKASVEHPLIGSVLEAVSSHGHSFYAREKFQGKSLEEHHKDGLGITPLNLARILRGLADAFKYLESKNVATLPLTLNDVFLDEQFHCRIVNMVVDEAIDASVFTKDKQLLGMFFHDLLEPDHPGSTRMGSLLDYMTDMKREIPLTWEQIYDLSDEVEKQLAESSKNELIQSDTMQMKSIFSMEALAKIGIGVLVLAVIMGLGYYFLTLEKAPKGRSLNQLIPISAGEYMGPDGEKMRLKGCSIAAYEVSIAEYAKFLKAFDLLPVDSRKVYQHKDQPIEKKSHLPDDWDALYSAAKAAGEWNGLEVDLNCPVVGVDWWDAYAYAAWMGRTLPTRNEWYLSGSAGGDMNKLQGTGWKPVDKAEKTKLGVYGLAGNVSEWTLKKMTNPADPIQPPRYVICGASYLKPTNGANACEWVDDRRIRRKDLGFRTIKAFSEED